MSLLGLIPMKGHSERVPRKNLRSFAGRPLFHWVTHALLGANQVDEVVIDTDSDEIEMQAMQAFPDVSVHRRPDHLHGDLVPMHDVVAEVAGWTTHDHLLQTHSTNPLLRSSTIDEAISAYLGSGEHDSLMSVTPWQSRFFFADGHPVNHDPGVLVRTQDLEPLLEENSNLYISSRSGILETGLRMGASPLLFRIDAEEATDIDDELDFRIAEFLLEQRNV